MIEGILQWLFEILNRVRRSALKNLYRAMLKTVKSRFAIHFIRPTVEITILVVEIS